MIARIELDEQFEFLSELGEMIEQLAEQTDALRSVREQSGALANRAGDGGLSDEMLHRSNRPPIPSAGSLHGSNGMFCRLKT